MTDKIIIPATGQSPDAEPVEHGDSWPDCKCRIELLGDTGVGKNSLMHRFLKDEFVDYVARYSISGVQSRNIVMDGKTVQVQLSDQTGDQRFRPIPSTYAIRRTLNLVVFELTCRVSYDNAKQWVDDASAAFPDVPILLVGCKSDQLTQRVIEFNEASDYVKTCDKVNGYIETSAKDNINVYAVFQTAASLSLTHIQEKKRASAVELKTAMGERNAPPGYGYVVLQKVAELLDKPDLRTRITQKLTAHIAQIESHTQTGSESNRIDFSYGLFPPVFKRSRAINNEANYYLAVKLLNKVRYTTTPLKQIFDKDELSELRDNIISDKKLYVKQDFVNRGINDATLNEVIRLAQQEKSAPTPGGAGRP